MNPNRRTKIARSDVNVSVCPTRKASTTVIINRKAVPTRWRGL
jgi:hypothetical protein